MGRKEIVRKSQAKRRANFKAQGLCVQCGGIPITGKTLCEKCAEKQRLTQKRYKERKKCTQLNETE